MDNPYDENAHAEALYEDQLCIEQMKDDPILFCELALGMKLNYYQKLTLAHYHDTNTED